MFATHRLAMRRARAALNPPSSRPASRRYARAGAYFLSGRGLRCLLTTRHVPSRLTQTSVKW